MEDGSRKFNVTVVSRTCVICELTCRASNKELVRNSSRKRDLAHMSERSLGPRAGSYRPPMLGLFRSSRSTGFTICLTDILRISSADKKENETPVTVDGRECAMFISNFVEQLIENYRLEDVWPE